MSRIRCFLLEPTLEATAALRRYSRVESACPADGRTYHNAETPFGTARVVEGEDGHYRVEHDGEPPQDDPRWPSQCACGYVFTPDDEHQVFTDRLYRRSDTGELSTLRAAPAGAIWRATWFEDFPHLCGPDGRAYVCRTPGGEWHIDGRASNCTMREDAVHRCWIRHGEAPDFTVDKNGNTCAAGAGSILAGAYHGFLRGGCLEQC